jgi:hypothetical protein
MSESAMKHSGTSTTRTSNRITTALWLVLLSQCCTTTVSSIKYYLNAALLSSTKYLLGSQSHFQMRTLIDALRPGKKALIPWLLLFSTQRCAIKLNYDANANVFTNKSGCS